MLLAWLPEAECLAALQQYSLKMPSNVLLLIRSESLYLEPIFWAKKKKKFFSPKRSHRAGADLAFVCVWGGEGRCYGLNVQLFSKFPTKIYIKFKRN